MAVGWRTVGYGRHGWRDWSRQVPDRPIASVRGLTPKHYGNFGNLSKSGLRFSRKACLPSCASSDR